MVFLCLKVGWHRAIIYELQAISSLPIFWETGIAFLFTYLNIGGKRND